MTDVESRGCFFLYIPHCQAVVCMHSKSATVFSVLLFRPTRTERNVNRNFKLSVPFDVVNYKYSFSHGKM